MSSADVRSQNDNNINGNLGNPIEKQRKVRFTQAQIERLEAEFQRTHYLGDREAIVRQTGLTTGQIEIWFRKRRALSRRVQRKQKLNESN